MKRTLLYLVALLTLASCQKDPDIPIVSLTVNDNVEAEWLEAKLSGTAVANTKMDALYVQFSSDEGISDFTEYQTIFDGNNFTIKITGLTPNTAYYYRYRGANKYGSCMENQIRSFKTKDCAVPEVSTKEVIDISTTSANCKGTVKNNGGADITEWGVCYSTSSTLTINDNKVKALNIDKDVFTCVLSNLPDGSILYVRAYAINKIGVGYGDVMQFTTLSYDFPSVATVNIENISYTTARCDGTITSDGGTKITECGVCYATTTLPTIDDKKVQLFDVTEGAFSCELTNLAEGTVYYARTYAANKRGTSYGEEKHFITRGNGVEQGHDFVELGLPSGLKWATCNKGAYSPEGYGDYYAWGDKHWKTDFTWSTYYYCEGSETTLTKYCWSSNYGKVDYKETLMLYDDPAHFWNGYWRSPTEEEWDELINNCAWTWTTQNSVNGYKVSSKVSGNNNSIFLPAGGHRVDKDKHDVGTYGQYWSATVCRYYTYQAYHLDFYNSKVRKGTCSRYYGFSIRPVCK